MKTLVELSFTLIALGAGVCFTDSAEPSPTLNTLSRISLVEMPAKAADLVKQGKPAEQAALTLKVVGAALSLNSSAAPTVVGAIARSVATMASVAAGAAAERQPRQASAIAKAAAAAAPSMAGQIVKAVCTAVPWSYQQVALAVASAAPGSDAEILRAVASVIPEFRAEIERALGLPTGRNPSVVVVLGTMKPNRAPVLVRAPAPTSVSEIGPLGGGQETGSPVFRPPFRSSPATITNLTPSSSGDLPAGGRNYAAPSP